MSPEHFQLPMAKTKLLIFCPEPAPPTGLPIFVNGSTILPFTLVKKIGVIGLISVFLYFSHTLYSISRSCELYLQNILEPLFTTPPATVFLGHHYLSPGLLQSPPKWSLSFHILPSPFSGYYRCSFLRDPAET